MKRKRLFILGLAFLAASYFMFSGGSPQEEVLKEIASSVRSENIAALMDHFSDSYHGSFGETKDALKKFALVGFQRFDDIKVIFSKAEVLAEHSGEVQMAVEFKVVAGFDGRRYYTAGGPAKTEKALFVFTRESGTWQIGSITLETPGTHPPKDFKEYENILKSL